MTSTASDAPSPPPDWDNVPFDVGCARCGHDLRGLSESSCPACNLEFDWADAVPIEQLICLHCGYHLYGLRDTRCPECGESFNWDEVLRTYRSHLKPLFEYRWRDQPVRSFVRTWFRALRPGKFWKSIDIHDPPQVAPLLVMTVVMLVAITFACVVMYGIDIWIWQSGWIPRSQGGWVQSTPRIAELPEYLLRAAGDRNAYYILVPMLFWISASFLALMVFPQSMRLCKVRPTQVLRVWAHALLPIVPVACAIGFAYGCVIGWRGYPRSLDRLLALLVLAHATWSLRCGYKTYLCMPHSIWIAVASQIIAVLAAGLCELLASSNSPGTVFFQIVDIFG